MKKLIVLIISNIFILTNSLGEELFHILTDNYPPISFEENSKVLGIATEIISEAFQREKIKHDFEVLPWARAYNDALKKENTAVFATYRTSEREALFKWVGPVVDLSWTLFALKSSNIKAKKIEDLKEYEIGGCIGEAFSDFLISKGFILQLVSEHIRNIIKLQHKRIDLWATDDLIGWEISNKQKIAIKTVLTVKKQPLYLALNLATKNSVVNKLNQSLINMKNNGFIENILKKYKMNTKGIIDK
jgi:polar amino acid transport system substrate-binding protein